MLNVKDLIIDPRSLGDKLLLVDVAPTYEYNREKRRTDTVTGYRYTIVMPEKAFEKIGVKIEGKQLMEKPESALEVKFTGLELFIYIMDGRPQVGARATGVSLVNTKP